MLAELNQGKDRNPAETVISTGFIAHTSKYFYNFEKRWNADPKKVSEAVILRTLSYQEAWEMSYFGENVLHPRTIIPVMKYNILILIRNVFNLSAPGTIICQQPIDENLNGRNLEAVVKAFATIDNLALVNVEGTGMAGVPGTSNAIFSVVKEVGTNVIMMSQASSKHSVCFVVLEKVGAVSEILQSRFREALSAGRLSKVEVIRHCSILAAVG
ncbi:hypothetical protein J5N97_029606 [Dioscorea zingiberensis]|uniref:aspartate kinase n=1 Tax=Dioscorea zingiberensis TaxID=325984 RepID=A0A9D5BW98_9LILI|nr:hypothetical protein J5N97_029606 [Dioscorea zingiberensis]